MRTEPYLSAADTVKEGSLGIHTQCKAAKLLYKGSCLEHVLVTRRLVPTLQAEGPSVPLNVLSF